MFISIIYILQQQKIQREITIYDGDVHNISHREVYNSSVYVDHRMLMGLDEYVTTGPGQVEYYHRGRTQPW